VSDLLPEESDSAEIGHLVKQSILAQMPKGWRPQDLSGDSDAGLDALVQVVIDGRYAEAFHAQYKGSGRPVLSAEGDFVPVRMRISTVNYYRRIGLPVMLVFADLSADSNPGTSPIYYLWIHETLDEALAQIAADATQASTVTFRIPTSNRFHSGMDVAPFLAAEREGRERLRTLSAAINGVPLAPSPSSAFDQIANNISSRGAAYLESTLLVTDAPWADPAPGTVAWALKQLSERISGGAVVEAQSLLIRIEGMQLRDVYEAAELAFLRGGLARLRGEPQITADGFAEAHRLVPASARYMSAWMEDRLLKSLECNDAVLALLNELDSGTSLSEPKMRALRARMLTLLERFDEAKIELDQLPPRYAAIERAVWLLVQRRLDEVVSFAIESQSLDIGRQTIFTLRVLAARARFEKVFAVKPGDVSPPTGPPGLDPVQLPQIWNELRELVRDLSSAGWPPNSEFVLDALTAVSIAAGKAEEGLVFVDSFLRLKPFRREFQMPRLKLAVFAGRYEIALDAAATIDDEGLRAIHLALIHYQAGHFRKSVDLVPKLVVLPFDLDALLPEALVVAAHSASRSFNIEAEAVCRRRLTEGGFSDRLAVLDAVVASGSAKATKAEARRALQAAYESSPNSVVLQEHVISAMRLSDPVEAKVLLEATGRISNRRQLRPEEVRALAEALVTLGRPVDAIEALEHARLRFPENADLAATEALICEKHGDVARARGLLTALLASADTSELARSVYIDIAVRSGLLAEATAQLESLLAAADTNAKRKNLLRSLFSVELYRDKQSPRLIRLAQKFGDLVERNSEEQEGIFLQMIMIAGVLATTEPTKKEGEDIQKRVLAYTNRFPDSKYFSSVPIPTDGGIDAFEQALKKKLGRSVEESESIQKLRQQIKLGQVAMPIAWRPRLLIPSARTVPQLWEMTKRSGKGNALLNFDTELTQRPMVSPPIGSMVPLFDLVSLLIVTDLGLWPTVFRMFDRIAICKASLLLIQYDDGPLSVPSKSLSNLRNAIRDYVDRSDQPGNLDDNSMPGREGLEEEKRLSQSGLYLFFSDDVAARIFVLGDNENGLSTSRLIRKAEELGHLTRSEAARKIAQLSRWNIGGLWVDDRYLLECLPEGLQHGLSVSTKILALHSDPDYQILISGVWDPPKPYVETVSHIVRLLVLVIRNNPEVDDQSIAAILASWLDKVALRPDVPLTIERHLAGVVTSVCWDVRASPFGAHTIWRAYMMLVERRHAARMDETIEKDAIREVGRLIASGTAASPDMRNRTDDLLTAVRKGLTEGTAPDQYLMEGFNETREEQASELAARRRP
jgi:tetratricopeptide (TPR) repeat protein